MPMLSHRQESAATLRFSTRHSHDPHPPTLPTYRRAPTTAQPAWTSRRGGGIPQSCRQLALPTFRLVNKTMRPISSSSSRLAGGAPRTSRRRRLCLAATLVMGAVAGTAAMHQPHRPFDAGKGGWDVGLGGCCGGACVVFNFARVFRRWGGACSYDDAIV